MDAALDAALLVFRERGYNGSSLAELGSAMRLTPGSIYKAFKDKRDLFLAAFDRYTQLRHQELGLLLDAQPTGRAKIKALLTFLAQSAYGAEGRVGCLVVGSATDISTFDPEMAARVRAAMNRNERLLRDLINLGKSDGSIASSVDTTLTANTLLYLTQGFRVLGKVGRTQGEMLASVEQAMKLID